ncbi:MAG: antibiotic biosynthesis monooxygenase family protein [Acidimicrobiales bacterium]
MIRRFETYAFLPYAGDAARRRVADILRRAGEFIPEVLHSQVGWDVGDSAAELVWEQAYESPESYRRYMVHPYHADLIDRHILADSPERLVETARGAGLFGYHCAGPSFASADGARVVVLLAVDGDPDPVVSSCDDAARAAGALVVSSGANTMASSWFDAETTLPGPPPRWSHVWEGGFAELGTAAAFAEEATARLGDSSALRRSAALVYTLAIGDVAVAP